MMRETTDGTATYGVSREVTEPTLDSVAGASVKLGTGQTGGIGTSDQRTFDAFPPSRDWQVTLQATRTQEGAPIFRQSPLVRALVTYGTGATSADLEVDVPAVGLTLHVAAQWVAVSMRVFPPFLGTPGRVLTEAAVVPGTPRTWVYGARVAHAGDVVRVRVPPFAVGVAVLTLDVTEDGTIASLGEGVWFYRGADGGDSGLTGELPLTSQAALVTTLRVQSQGVAVPASANLLELQPPSESSGGFHLVQWEIQS